MADILIVDDEQPVRTLLSRFVTAAGHGAREAGDAQEAEAAMAAIQADVVLCDIHMPGEHDGVWLTNDLRRRYPHSAVVLVTGDHSVPPATSLRDGVVAYIVKPFNRDGVLHAVGLAMNWRHSSKAVRSEPLAAQALSAWLETVDEVAFR